MAEFPPEGGRNPRKDSNGSGNYQQEKMDRSLDSSNSRLVMFSVEIFKTLLKAHISKSFFLLIIKFCTWNVSKKIFNKSFEDQQ